MISSAFKDKIKKKEWKKLFLLSTSTASSGGAGIAPAFFTTVRTAFKSKIVCRAKLEISTCRSTMVWSLRGELEKMMVGVQMFPLASWVTCNQCGQCGIVFKPCNGLKIHLVIVIQLWEFLRSELINGAGKCVMISFLCISTFYITFYVKLDVVQLCDSQMIRLSH